MKLFVVICSLMVSAATAQLRDPKTIPADENKTPECPRPPQPARERRQAEAAPPPKLFSWYTTNGEVLTPEQCEERNKKAIDAEKPIAQRGPVLVQRGVYDVCVKFDEAPTWFFTRDGTNALCDPTKRCCEWFPPYNSPCSSVEGIFWFETKDGDCKATWDSMNTDALDRESLFGVDYIYGATKGEKRQVCHITNPDQFRTGEAPELLSLDVEIIYCGEKCCVYKEI